MLPPPLPDSYREAVPCEITPAPSPPFPGIAWSLALVFLVLLMQLMLGLTAGIAFSFIDASLALHPLTLGLLNLVSFSLIIGMALVWIPRPWGPRLGFRTFPLWWLLPATAGMAGLQVVLSDFVNVLIHLLPPPENLPLPGDLFFGSGEALWASAITLVLIAPLTEELLFRGIMMHGLLGRHRNSVAILVSGVLFGLLHLFPWQVVPTAIIGIVLGWMRVYGGTIFLCLWAHLINSAMALVGGALLPLEIPGYNAEPLDGEILQPWWFTTGGAVTAVAAFLVMAAAFRRRPGL
jgi:membrane protease YdiL (CAAX protease family)